MKLVGANSQARVVGERVLPGIGNYFSGRDPKQWRTNIPNYERVRYEEVYSGVDLVYHGDQQQMEYDFVISPKADPRVIALEIAGADNLAIDAQGDLLLKVGVAQLRQLKPSIYQEVEGVRKAVAGRYLLNDKRQIGFQIGSYDRDKPLIIDPVLVYSTYLGGSGADEGAAVTTDLEGNAYVTGTTDSLNFPTSAGAFQTLRMAGKDVFVTKLKPNGTAVVYSTYLGGALDDNGYGIAVDGAGNAYVTGTTASTDFPATVGALQTFNGGGTDAFVTRLNSTGSALVYSTYLGGSGNEEGFGIAVNSSGNAYVTGVTASTNFPTTAGVMQNALAGTTDAFITKLTPSGAAAVYSTYLGGSGADIGFAIALNAVGDNAYVTGLTDSTNFPTTAGAFRTGPAGNSDAFVIKLNGTGSAPGYSTLLGGSGIDGGFGIAVDSGGNAYVTGVTDAANFATTTGTVQQTNGGGSSDAFVTKLNPEGTAVVYGTYLGGSGGDTGVSIGLDYKGDAYVTGTTSSVNFPATADATQPTLSGGNDAFLATLNIDGTALSYSTYIGGAQNEESFGIAVDSAHAALVTGSTLSSNFPTTANAYQTIALGNNEAFVTKIGNMNPLDSPEFFVRQHYLDFLGRQPDAAGLNFWTIEIDDCKSPPQCTEVKRINVSAAFYLSIEFQETGYLIERIYKASYGDAIGASNFNGAHQLRVPAIRLNEFLPDTHEIGQGVVVGVGNWQQQLETNKQAFASAFVQRPRFTAAFPTSMTPATFVNTLNTNAGNPLSPAERDQLVNDLSTGAKTRAQVLRAVAEDPDLNSAEFNRAFVLIQYFGYMRRNPNDAPDSDYGGYDFWLTKLNQFNGNFINAEMIKAFILSTEYRQRFGP